MRAAGLSLVTREKKKKSIHMDALSLVRGSQHLKGRKAELTFPPPRVPLG